MNYNVESTGTKLDDIAKESISFRLPKKCIQDVRDSKKEVNSRLYKKILMKYGVVLINLTYEDGAGHTLVDIVRDIGIPHTHDQKGRILWDIKSGGETGKESIARSHGSDEFVFHTDCSYERDVPSHFGLYVISPDMNGGGTNLLVNTSLIFQKLSDISFRTLKEQQVRIKIPPEFHKGTDYIKGYIIDENLNIRYRRDILDEKSCSTAQIEAINELDNIIYDSKNTQKINLNKNSILLVDNYRYLHARTQIRDSSRHLKRVRFNLKL